LRDELDQLEELGHQESAEYMARGGIEEDDDMEMATDVFEYEDALGFDDVVTVAEAGSQEEVDAETLVLSIRSTSEHETSDPDAPPPILNAVS
jgi:alcohol dehydrogenase YqhD (iron-dependent ADH family)